MSWVWYMRLDLVLLSLYVARETGGPSSTGQRLFWEATAAGHCFAHDSKGANEVVELPLLVDGRTCCVVSIFTTPSQRIFSVTRRFGCMPRIFLRL